MSFSNIHFKVTNAEVNNYLKQLVADKFESLKKFIGEAPFVCEVEFEKVTHHNTGDIYRLETNLEVNGKFYRAEATEDSFEKAIDAVRSDLERELRHQNTKRDTMLRRGGRKLKEMLRFG